eukprot:3437699-Rhodomonas_salina.1
MALCPFPIAFDPLVDVCRAPCALCSRPPFRWTQGGKVAERHGRSAPSVSCLSPWRSAQP